jgi:uncharacterized membrane protein
MFDPTLLHPMIVHFPIALLIVGFVSDLLGALIKRDFFSKVGFSLLILGTLGVVAAYFSGDFAGEGLAEGGPLKQALEAHESAAMLSLWLMTATALVRIVMVATKKFTGALRWIPVVMFLIGVLSIARTGFYGGELVFKHAAGVQLSLDDTLGNNADVQQPEETDDSKD